MKKILVTGGAGFIGSHLIDHLLTLPDVHITNVDNMDEFYPRSLKEANIAQHLTHDNYEFWEADIFDYKLLFDLIDDSYDLIIHLAAKAGVRPSIQNPQFAQKINVEGTLNLLEIARYRNIPKFISASSSSVYGINQNVPWSEEDRSMLPISPYAATKIGGEHLGHVYSHLYGIQFTALRFFTVYGPRQRPDLAIHKFFRKIYEGAPIQMYGDGTTMRDYTYVSDIVQGIVGAIAFREEAYSIFNLGNSHAIKLKDLIAAIEETMGKKARIERLPEQAGDVPCTFANIERAQRHLNYQPHTDLATGLKAFYEWFLAREEAQISASDVK